MGRKWVVAGIVTSIIAVTQIVLLFLTLNPHLFPGALIAASCVVPITMSLWLIERHDKSGISFSTFVLMFLSGGTLGVICAIVFDIFLKNAGMAVFATALFAGVVEEPAKLLATSIRWRHPVYDKPIDGLLLGSIAGLGFAAFETAGYGFEAFSEYGLAGMTVNLFMRSLTAPFGHGLWAGITASAFWQMQRDPARALKSGTFLKALLCAVGLHALWNSGIGGDLSVLASAAISTYLFWRLLKRNGIHN